MRAARIHRYGDASVISLDDVPRPEPGPGEVLIRVAATSFNPTEIALRSGALATIFPIDLPFPLGWDVAGTVEEVGQGGSAFAVGDRVIGRLDTGGAAAEYVTAAAGALVPAPATIPLADAAAVPLAGLTAWQAVERAGIAAGQRVLINGAGGGIGMFAVRLARNAGAEVIATASPRSADVVRRYGAGTIIDYTVTPVRAALDAPVDVLLNLVGIAESEAASLPPLVRPGGVIVSVATPIEPPPDAAVTAWHVVARNDVADLATLTALIDAGAVTVDVAETYPLADLAVVHRRAEAGRTRGKITIVP